MSLEAIYRKSPPALQTLFLNAFAAKIAIHRYGPKYERAVQELRERERWPRDRMAQWQDERVRELIQFAYQNSELYRRRLDEAGVRPGDVRGTEDLPRLPLLTKDDVRNSLPGILTASSPRRGWLHGHTSGTTGAPLDLWYDRETAILNNAVDRRQKIWGGMEKGDWLGLILGRVVVSPERDRPPFWNTNYVLRQVWFSAFHLEDATLPAYVEEIRRRRLRFLEGYPSTLYILARGLLEAGERLPIKAVFTSSETLHEVQREAIETAFECRIFDFYGHAERVIFATECERHDGKHVCEEYGFTEVVNAAGEPAQAEELGYLVGTSLQNRAMPMIRYRTGDVSRIIEEPCECGRSSRRIASVSTKAEDLIVTPEGRLISPSIMTHPFKPFPQIKKSQIIQESLTEVNVRLVVDESWSDELQRELMAGLERRLGGNMHVRVSRVTDIPPEPSGKYRWVISQVDHAAHVAWE